jgi:hypothetical protein
MAARISVDAPRAIQLFRSPFVLWAVGRTVTEARLFGLMNMQYLNKNRMTGGLSAACGHIEGTHRDNRWIQRWTANGVNPPLSSRL